MLDSAILHSEIQVDISLQTGQKMCQQQERHGVLKELPIKVDFSFPRQIKESLVAKDPWNRCEKGEAGYFHRQN